MNEQRRPVRVADLLLLCAFVAFVFAFVVPAYRFAFDADQNVASITDGLLGPICILATIGVVALPILHMVLGLGLVRSRGSFVTHTIAIAIVFNAISSGFASATIGRACAMLIAG